MALSLIQCLALCGSTCYLQIKSAYSEQCDGHGRLTCQCHERRDRHGSPAHPGIGRRCATSRSHVHLEAHTLSCSPCGSLCCLRWHERLGNGATPCTCTEGFADGGAAGVHSCTYEAGKEARRTLRFAPFICGYTHKHCFRVSRCPSQFISLINRSPRLHQALAITTGLFGTMTALSLFARPGSMLRLGVPLGAGVLMLLACGIAGMFVPVTSAWYPLLHSVQLYGGLGLFTLYVAYDTQVCVSLEA